MVARNEIYWADVPGPTGRRPVCILTRNAAIGALARVTCAPVTRTVRGIASEVEVGRNEGLAGPAVITCDNVLTIPQAFLDPEPVGRLNPSKRVELDRALRYALDIVY